MDKLSGLRAAGALAMDVESSWSADQSEIYKHVGGKAYEKMIFYAIIGSLYPVNFKKFDKLRVKCDSTNVDKEKKHLRSTISKEVAKIREAREDREFILSEVNTWMQVLHGHNLSEMIVMWLTGTWQQIDSGEKSYLNARREFSRIHGAA